MLAVVVDSLLVTVALVAVAAFWLRRKGFALHSVWEKLMAGSTMVALALIVRMADFFWAESPWPVLADIAVQQVIIAIGLIGGGLAMAAALADWIPQLMLQHATGAWRESWAKSMQQLDARLRGLDAAHGIIDVMLEQMRPLCGTPRVEYCAFRQRTRTFVRHATMDTTIPADWQAALERVQAARIPEAHRTAAGWIMTIPVAVENRLYGAIVVSRSTEHQCLHDVSLLGQLAQRTALALHAVVHRALQETTARMATSSAQLERLLGVAEEPSDDLMTMLEFLHRELHVDYAACLLYEGDGAYALRYSQFWDSRRLCERGLQVSIGHGVLPQSSPNQIYVTDRGEEVLSPAAVPYEHLRYRVAIPLRRGGRAIGALVAATHTEPVGLKVLHALHTWSPHFTTAIERIANREESRKLARRCSSLGETPALARDMGGFDSLTAEMLDQIPGTFCQYMRVLPDQQTLRIDYRRTKREGWGENTIGRMFGLDDVPNCRMVIENGRSVLFRQDDPERHYESEEAQQLFGAVPNSLLLAPVVDDGVCTAVLAVGEMREPHRHTYSAQDRRFADSLVRLRMAGGAVDAQRLAGLDSFGDLNFTFASPLTGIMGSVEILKQQMSPGSPYTKYLNVIERNADRIRGAVTQLAEYQHGEMPSYVRRHSEAPVL
jgi:hypothetical protein